MKRKYTIIVIMAILFLVGGIVAYFMSTINKNVGIGAGQISLQSTIVVNGNPNVNEGFFIGFNEIKKIDLEVNNNQNSDNNAIKVRSKVFLRVEFKPDTPDESINAIRLYSDELTDEEIQEDANQEIPMLAIIPRKIHNVSGEPIVLQYEITDQAIAIDVNETKTLSVKMIYHANLGNTYDGIYANLYSVVTSIQHRYTQDSDIDMYIQKHQLGIFPTTISATGITLNENEITIKGLMEGAILYATILPATTSNRTVTWTSSDPTVATVDSNGIIVSRSVGQTTITAKTHNSRTTTCIVTVEE